MARKNKDEIVSIEIVDINGEPFDLEAYACTDECAKKLAEIIGPYIIQRALEERKKSLLEACEEIASTEP